MAKVSRWKMQNEAGVTGLKRLTTFRKPTLNKIITQKREAEDLIKRGERASELLSRLNSELNGSKSALNNPSVKLTIKELSNTFKINPKSAQRIASRTAGIINLAKQQDIRMPLKKAYEMATAEVLSGAPVTSALLNDLFGYLKNHKPIQNEQIRELTKAKSDIIRGVAATQMEIALIDAQKMFFTKKKSISTIKNALGNVSGKLLESYELERKTVNDPAEIDQQIEGLKELQKRLNDPKELDKVANEVYKGKVPKGLPFKGTGMPKTMKLMKRTGLGLAIATPIISIAGRNPDMVFKTLLGAWESSMMGSIPASMALFESEYKKNGKAFLKNSEANLQNIDNGIQNIKSYIALENKYKNSLKKTDMLVKAWELEKKLESTMNGEKEQLLSLQQQLKNLERDLKNL